MKTAYLVDLDGTLVEHANDQNYRANPQAKAVLDKLGADPDNEIWFFSCWAFGPIQIAFLQREFPYAKGFLRKPLTDRYVFIDDKHDAVASREIEKGFPLITDARTGRKDHWL